MKFRLDDAPGDFNLTWQTRELGARKFRFAFCADLHSLPV
jgi:hypothetical protein